MKRILLTLSTFLTTLSFGELVITEVMSDSRHLDSSVNGDWWELTNNGSVAVNLSGYSWDDDSNTSGLQTFPTFSIQAGESVILLNEATSSARQPFRDAWGLPSSVRIFVESDFGNFPGFSGGSGDTIYLYNPSGAVIDSFSFGSASSGSSFSNFENGNPIPGGLSELDVFGAFTTTENPADIGSPGIAPAIPPPVSPSFEGPLELHWLVGQNTSALEILPSAVDPNPGDTITLSVTNKPDWLTITFPGNGVINFSGTPTTTEIGINRFTLNAIDNSGLTPSTEVTFTLNVLPLTSSIILNEYNAVGENFFLDGAEEDEIGAPTDSNLGQIQGNGGEWIEFVITGDDSSTVDLRGHTIVIVNNDFHRHSITLSDHIALSELIPGTILTLSANFQTHLNKESQLSSNTSETYLWSNIWLFDPILIDQENSIFSNERVIGDQNTRVVITAPSGTVIYGPSGESTAAFDTNNNAIPDTLVAIPDTEVFKLEQNPTSAINPLFATYNDGSSSTFGAPNTWSSSTQTQSFASFAQTNSPPKLTSLPDSISVRGVYNSQISFSDPDTPGVTITASGVPPFLTFSDNGTGTATLLNNRPLTANDIGTYNITILADDGQASASRAYHPFQLKVFNPSPEVILNEYNGVSDGNHLNGGDINFDSNSASTTRDPFFGRDAGNGGDWFELIVIGNGGPSIVDLRGWTIKIGEGEDNGEFNTGSIITLSQDDFWAAVPAGTLLTFIVNDTANGGLDTKLNSLDEFSSNGWGWSNINLGDTSMVTVSGLIDIDSTRTQFIISDTEKVVFGPVGEGFLDGVNVSNEEIFALEANPRTTTSMFDNGDLNQGAGYDDGRIDSTFGARNRYLPSAGAVAKVEQDFTPFIPPISTFTDWASGFDVPADAAVDSDNDGWNNLEEYLFGGIPNDRSIFPQTVINTIRGTITFDVRADDAAYTFTGERSSDLQSWTHSDIVIDQGNSPLGASFHSFTIIYEESVPKQFFRVRVN